jgi:hypothetical protein
LLLCLPLIFLSLPFAFAFSAFRYLHEEEARLRKHQDAGEQKSLVKTPLHTGCHFPT